MLGLLFVSMAVMAAASLTSTQPEARFIQATPKPISISRAASLTRARPAGRRSEPHGCPAASADDPLVRNDWMWSTGLGGASFPARR